MASGHHDVPRMPEYPGRFAGEIIHSRAYKSPRQVRDKRVLVVGCGNSATDIVSDAVHGSSRVVMSLRRGYWFVPKFMLGFPTHDVVSWVEFFPLPRLVKRWLFQASLWVLQGPPSRYQLPDPDYSIDQAHPTMSDEIPRLAAHGRIAIKPEIAGYDGNRVLFTDGTAETVDMIVFATGYEPVVPFLDESLMYDAEGRSRFYLRVLHPEYDGLFAAGLVQANGSMWRIADYQGQLIANLIVAEAKAPDYAARFRAGMASSGDVRRAGTFLASDRHRLEANYYDYRRLLKRHIRRFGPVRRMRLDPSSPGRTPQVASFATASRPRKWPADIAALLRRRGDVDAILAPGQIALRPHLHETRCRPLEQELHVARRIELVRLGRCRGDQRHARVIERIDQIDEAARHVALRRLQRRECRRSARYESDARCADSRACRAAARTARRT